MKYLARLKVNNLLAVPVLIFVDCAVDTDELAILVTVLYT